MTILTNQLTRIPRAVHASEKKLVLRRLQVGPQKTRFSDRSLGHLVSSSQEIDLTLGPGQVLALNGDKRGLQLVCSIGRLWVTQTSDQEDYMLAAGDRFVISKPGTVLIQGVRQGKLRLVPLTNE